MKKNTRDNPYVGPRSFETGENNIFYGRERETRSLLAQVISERVVLLHSPSGAGKTSLIKAGLIPLLEQEQFHILPIARVNHDTDTDFVKPAGFNRYVFSALLAMEESVAVEQRRPAKDLAEMSLDTYLKTRPIPADAPESQMLIFDQFEEILTVDPADLKSKQEFFTQLGSALRNRDRWALVAMREDYLGAIAPFVRPIPNRFESTFRLDLLGPQSALQAIQNPCEKVGVEFDVLAAQKLIDDLRSIQVQLPDGSMQTQIGQYIEPVQLQVVCYRLWDNLEADDVQITEEDLNVAGNVNSSLRAYYSDSVENISTLLNSNERFIREWFHTRLITEQGIRSQVLMGQEKSGDLSNAAIQKLEDVHLVRAERRGGATWFELSHDRLIKPIRDDNLNWFEAVLSPLQRQAKQWKDSNGNGFYLFRDEVLAKAEEWARGHESEMLDFEKDFLRACKEERTRSAAEKARQAGKRANLAETGWGIIFPANMSTSSQVDIKQALKPLLELRKKQASERRKEYYREFIGEEEGYRNGENANDFLKRHGVAFQLRRDKVPYYLLIVGDPETIPFEFQYGLALRYAVGRIHFESPEEYASYARSVVFAESGQLALPREIALWATANPDDRATNMMLNSLTRPLSQHLQSIGSSSGWSVKELFGDDATREGLGEILGGEATPALLFTSSHGMNFIMDDERIFRHQGALLGQEWPGPKVRGPVTDKQYFSADNIPDDAQLSGLIAFLFSAYGAGTPRFDDFYRQAYGKTKEIAPKAFLSRLPQRLLGHANGGALAVISHVERTWGGSVQWEGEIDDISAFEELFSHLLEGYTVGAAMEAFTQRYAMMSALLVEYLLANDTGAQDDIKLAGLYTSIVDARNYIILGDPAVRLPVCEFGKQPVPRNKTGLAQQNLETGGLKTNLVFNGVNALTGEYLLPALPVSAVSEIAQDQVISNPAVLNKIKRAIRKISLP